MQIHQAIGLPLRPGIAPASGLPRNDSAALRAKGKSDGNGSLSAAELSALLDDLLPRQDRTTPAAASTAENELGLRAADQQPAPPPRPHGSGTDQGAGGPGPA